MTPPDTKAPEPKWEYKEYKDEHGKDYGVETVSCPEGWTVATLGYRWIISATASDRSDSSMPICIPTPSSDVSDHGGRGTWGTIITRDVPYSNQSDNSGHLLRVSYKTRTTMQGYVVGRMG